MQAGWGNFTEGYADVAGEPLHSSTPLPPRGPSLAARSSELAQSPQQPGPPSWDSRSLGSRREKTDQQGKTNWQPL